MNNSFSIITPNYNMGNYLEETIESVLDNLQKEDEYFVIEGGSTDNSVEIIRKYENIYRDGLARQTGVMLMLYQKVLKKAQIPFNAG